MPTSCEDCVFATWNDNKQVGCTLDKLNKLEANGAELKYEDNGERSYYKIFKVACKTCRNKKWGSENPKKDWESLVNKQVEIQCDFLVYVDMESTLEEIENTLKSISKQIILPKKVIVIVEYLYDNSSIEEIVGLMIDKLPPEVSWHLEEMKSTTDPIDESLKASKSLYYAIFYAGCSIASEFLDKLNKNINNDMIRIVAVKPNENDNGMFISRKVHDTLVGNKGGFILDKIEWLAKEQGYEDMIKHQDDL